MPASDLHGPWSVIRRAPMVRLAVPWIAGIALAHAADPQPERAVLPVLGITLPALFIVLSPHLQLQRWKRGVVLAAWLCAAGFAWQALRDPKHDPLGPWAGPPQGPYLVRVEAVSSVTPRSVRADAGLIAAFNRDRTTAMRGLILLTVIGDSLQGPVPGDLLLLDGDLEPIARVPDPGGFDRQAWARGRGIAHEMLVGRDDWLRVGHERRWTDLFQAAREQVGRWIEDSALPLRDRALVKALVLGLRDELDAGQRDAFARSGTIHVLAVSGMHVGLIYTGLAFLLQWMGKGPRARLWRGLIILAALWGYAGITGGSPSVMRAAFMFSVFTVAGIGRRQTDHLNSLFAAAFFLLIADPAMLLQASFLLSFLAVWGIVLWYRPLLALWSPETWLLKQAWSLTVVSFSAQLLTAPLGMWLFKAFPIWFLPANLIVVVAASLAVYGGVALIALHMVPVVGAALAWLMEALLGLVSAATEFFASLPCAYAPVRVDALQMTLLYVVIICVAAHARWRWRGMWRSAILGLACVIAIGAFTARKAAERSVFVVYDSHQGMMAGLVQGRSLVLVSASDSVLAGRAASTRIEQHSRAWGIEEVLPAGTDLYSRTAIALGGTVMGGGRWRSDGLDVRFLSSDRASAKCQKAADVLVLHDMNQLPDTSALGEARHWVIGPNVHAWIRRRLVELGASRGIAVHVVKADGAFVLPAPDHER